MGSGGRGEVPVWVSYENQTRYNSLFYASLQLQDFTFKPMFEGLNQLFFMFKKTQIVKIYMYNFISCVGILKWQVSTFE